ncbi:TetR/AcrR family transcriptional regulator [Demequina oxidasica]|uniref:TetR/AcrR family transcriptional regulator n=1 Tax=Demequina oxidasica TaxID=676199 RepID=UPI000A059D9E|nr:TetR/AcrR family transcriptional regulator [Demequina oxidasica]
MATSPPASPLKSRDRLVATATKLFYANGINATGIDTVIAESGATKGSMYHHFHNKDGLVAAYLRGEANGWHEAATGVDDSSKSPVERVALMFTIPATAIATDSFHGCPFTNAMVERPADPAIAEIVGDYRRVMAEHVADLIGAKTTDTVVAQVVVLYDGGVTGAKQTRSAAPVATASAMAQNVVRAWLKTGRD